MIPEAPPVDIQELRAQVQKKNEILRETLKTSYNRLRKIQTQCFQSHVAQQLTNILDLKQKQKLVSSSLFSDSTGHVSDATATNEALLMPALTGKVTEDFFLIVVYFFKYTIGKHEYSHHFFFELLQIYLFE